MNKNKKRIILILIMILFLTGGCTKYLTTEDKKKVTYKETGQTLPSNILCQPESKEVLELYEKNEKNMQVKISKLPSCDNFKINSNSKEYDKLWEVVFVKPLAFIILKIGQLVKNYGVAVMLIGLLIRLVMYPLSKNSLKQTESMKLAQPEIKKLEAKYKDKTDKESMMKKSEETMIIYKKYKIKPLTGCLFSFIQLPLFLAFLEAVNRVPAIFESNLFNFKLGSIPFHIQLGTTPLVGIKNGNYIYIFLIALLIVTTYFSLRNTMASQSTSEDSTQKQTQLMSKFMLVIISIASLSLPAAIGLYWIVTNAFTVVQNIIIKKRRA